MITIDFGLEKSVNEQWLNGWMGTTLKEFSVDEVGDGIS